MLPGLLRIGPNLLIRSSGNAIAPIETKHTHRFGVVFAASNFFQRFTTRLRGIHIFVLAFESAYIVRLQERESLRVHPEPQRPDLQKVSDDCRELWRIFCFIQFGCELLELRSVLLEAFRLRIRL